MIQNLDKGEVEQGTSCEVVKYSVTTPTPHSCRSWPLDSPVCPKLPGSVTQGLPFTTAQYLRETKTPQPRPCSALMRYVWSAQDPCHRTSSPQELTPKAVLTRVIGRSRLRPVQQLEQPLHFPVQYKLTTRGSICIH